MDVTCHHHTASNQKHLDSTRLETEPEEQVDQNVQSEDDIVFELQSFAESDDVFHDDATASVTDSCGTEEFDNDSFSSEDDDEQDDEESCCSYYDDEQAIACLQAASQDGKRGVRFSTVEIREYACTLGDHPSVQDSCPMTLDWRYARGHKRDINSYENSRFFMRRNCPQRLSPQERRRRIRETSRLSRRVLREMELEIAMRRLEVSMSGIYDFWGEIDGQQASSDPDGFLRANDDTIESD